jgi:hypothetical protein
MKRRITKVDLISYIKLIDTRCKKWTDEEFDRVINDGFAELCTVINPFVADVTEDLAPYYEIGELNFTINIPSDVNDIYDLYLVHENRDEFFFLHGEEKDRDKNRIWRDSKDLDIVHVDLHYPADGAPYDLAVIKYSYIPTSEFDELFLSNDVYIALQSAISSASYNVLKDVESSGQMRSQYKRQASAVLNPYPDDYNDNAKPSMFPEGF